MLRTTRYHRMLGIAIGEQSMLVAEVVSSAGAPHVTAAREFSYPSGVSLKEPDRLGEALGRFLHEQNISTRAAVFGLPARWVLSKRKQVPAADEQLVSETLRLQADSEFAPELSDMVYDYSGQAGSNGTGSVLLMAVPRKQISQVTTLAESAKLRVRAITPSVTAVANAIAPTRGEGMMLLVGPGGAEFTAQQNGSPGVLRYVGPANAPAPLLTGELRRATAMVAPNGQLAVNGHTRELTIWNDSGVDESALQAAGQAIGVSLRRGELSDLRVEGAAALGTDRSYATPISLALTGLSPRIAVDFAHSRLAPPPQRRVDRRMVLAIAAAVMVVFGLGYWAFDIHQRQTQIEQQEADLKANETRRETAKQAIDRAQFARAWHSTNPRFLACLRDLTLAGPPGGQLYGTSLSLHDDMSGSFSGKGPDEQTILAFRDRLKNAGHFEDLSLQYDSRDAGKSHEIGFTILFTYSPPR